jgi:hypothetical protein
MTASRWGVYLVGAMSAEEFMFYGSFAQIG